MAKMKVEFLYRNFMITPVSHLPVVDSKNSLIGLLSKEKVVTEMADLSLAGKEFETIPESFLEFQMTESLVHFFQNNRTIPVLNQLGQKMEGWDKPRFLAELSKLNQTESQEVNKESKKPKIENENRQAIYRYMELILQNFPDPLFATDKEGETSFYNEQFEKSILAHSAFKDSISYAERFFHDLNRELISNYYSQNDHDGKEASLPALSTYVKAIDFVVRVITLFAEEKVVGFLYHFLDPKSRLSSIRTDEEIKFPSLEEAFVQNFPLEKVMKEVESHYIYHKLKNNSFNISHSAAELGLPRSTLQTRIRFLKIVDKFKINLNQPIPRKKKEKKGEEVSIQKEEIPVKLEKKPVRVISRVGKKVFKRVPAKPKKPLKTSKKKPQKVKKLVKPKKTYKKVLPKKKGRK